VTATPTLCCPICAAPSAVEHRLEDFTLCRCPECDHCFTDLNSIDYVEQYGPGYFEEEHRNWFLHPNLTLYEKLSRIILEHNPHAAILDVGCGNGNFLRYLRSTEKNLSLTGIDMAHNEPIAGIEYLRGDFTEQKFAGQFDVLVSLAVIEHIPNVTVFAKRLCEVCVPGGLVITMTVDERSLIYGASRTLHRAGYSVPLKRLYSKHHLNHFTYNSLKRLLEGHGLRTVQVLRHNSPMAAVDTPPTSTLSKVILRTGVWVAFQLGLLTRRTMLQTIISQKTDSGETKLAEPMGSKEGNMV
jgi:SAM-dependent methyltransferase